MGSRMRGAVPGQYGRMDGPRHPVDLYETQPEAVDMLFSHVHLSGPILEPSAGRGAIVNILRRHGVEVCVSPDRRPCVATRAYIHRVRGRWRNRSRHSRPSRNVCDLEAALDQGGDGSKSRSFDRSVRSPRLSPMDGRCGNRAYQAEAKYNGGRNDRRSSSFTIKDTDSNGHS